jgi:hypothetical protein
MIYIVKNNSPIPRPNIRTRWIFPVQSFEKSNPATTSKLYTKRRYREKKTKVREVFVVQYTPMLLVDFSHHRTHQEEENEPNANYQKLKCSVR